MKITDFVNETNIMDTKLAWEDVPVTVGRLVRKYAGPVGHIMAGEPNCSEGWYLKIPECGPVLVKKAETGFFPAVGNISRGIQTAMLGPNPLTAMLLGGALAAPVGYGAGWLLHKLLPQYFRKSTATRGALLSGLAGTVPGALLEAYPAVVNQGIKGLITRQPFQGGEMYKGSRFEGMVDDLEEMTHLTVDDPNLEKAALAGADYLPRVPTDEWGRVIMRDPFLDGPEKAIAAGLPAAAGAARGSHWVSPLDVAKVAAGAGLGAAFGRGLGAIAAPFLGLTPAAQEGIQRAGLLAGAIKMLGGVL